jgi:hypothetical protein
MPSTETPGGERTIVHVYFPDPDTAFDFAREANARPDVTAVSLSSRNLRPDLVQDALSLDQLAERAAAATRDTREGTLWPPR